METTDDRPLRSVRPPCHHTTSTGRGGSLSCRRTSRVKANTLRLVGFALDVAYLAPVQLVYSLHTALKAITEQSPSFTERLQAHKDASKFIKDSLTDLGFDFVPKSRDIAANGMTAVRLPEGYTLPDILPKLVAKDIVVAAGLHKAIATKYFRIGHMGVTATQRDRGDLEKVVKGIKEALDEVKQSRDGKL